MGALGGGPVTPRVLVDANDLGRAVALLGARPNLTSHPDATPLADEVWPTSLGPPASRAERRLRTRLLEVNGEAAPGVALGSARSRGPLCPLPSRAELAGDREQHSLVLLAVTVVA